MNKSLILLALTGVVSVSAETADSLKSVELQNVQVLSIRASKKTPMAFTDMSKKQLQQVNHGKDVPYLLSLTPSVTMSSDAGTGIGYTGIHVRGTDPTRINVTANGVPLNDGESSQLYWVNMGDFASSVQSMQVQRGVGTSTNGAGAFGATVNMQTDNLGTEPFATIDLSGGSYYTQKETFRFGTGLIGGHWAVQGRLSNISSKGYIDRASATLGSYFLQGGYFGDNTVVKLVTFNGQEKTYHAWDYASKADMEKYGRTYNPCGKYTDANGNRVYYDNQTDNYHQQHYQLILNKRLATDWKLNAALHYTKGTGYYEQYKTSQKLYKYWASTVKGDLSDVIRQKRMDNDFFGVIASANYDNHDRLMASIGGGWNKYDGDHYGKLVWVRTPSASQTINPNQTYYDNNAKKSDANIYGKLSYELIQGLNAYVDLQFRHVGYKSTGTSQEFNGVGDQQPLAFDQTYDFFNPKAGLSYQINRNHSVYASYAIAHKEPTRNDFEDMLAEADGVEPKAERLNDLEVGYKYQSPFFSAGLNLYYMNYKDQFVLTGAQDTNGEMIARNIDKSYRMGVELEAALRPFEGFKWDVNATWSKNRAKDMMLNVIDPNTWATQQVNVGETQLAYSPDWIVNNMFRYEYKGLAASLMTKYVGKQYMTNSGFDNYVDEDNGNQLVSAVIDAYCTTDLDVSYTFPLRSMKSITVGCTVYNLFNHEYESNGSCGINFKQDANGRVVAFSNNAQYFYSWATFSAQAPIHALAHVSLNF
ncbi:MAG: TonB-dependent receptor [Prevotella sp.]|nr:TonB-dependent receptor [Prevotella sp.]